jgi:leader peptidase (prepilin peptidase) / N-methyltransferase
MELWPLACTTVLGTLLIALSVVDLRTGYLPDPLQVALALAGTAVAFVGSPIGLPWQMALAGATVNGAVFFALRWLITRIKGREAMGFGDVKLIAAGGLWVGPIALPYIMAASGLLTLLGAGVVALVARRAVWKGEMPLGPGLAIGIFACFIGALFKVPGITP